MQRILMTLALLSASNARADEASDRRRAMSDIDRAVGEMARAFSGLAGSSSARGIDDALRKADRVRSTLRDLERVKGSDSKAREMISRYPRFIDQLKRARDPLRTLKKYQRALKKAPDQCKRFTSDLKQRIKDEIRADTPQSARRIRDLAKDLGRKAERTLRAADDQKRAMERAKSDARRFDASHGRWRDVKSNVHRAAEKMLDTWKRDYESTKRACKPIAQGERQSDVSRALDALKRQANKRQDLLKRAADGLKQVASQTRGLEGARGTDAIDRARSRLGALEGYVRDLGRIAGGDPKAKSVKNQWPKAIKATRSGLDTLARLKAAQFSADDLSDRCATATKTLVEQAKAAATRPAARTRDALIAAAKAQGKQFSEQLSRAEKRVATVKRAQSDVVRTRPSGDWRGVADGMKASADKMAVHYTRRLEQARKACGELAKGERHRDISRALDEIAKVLERVDRLFKAMEGDVRSLAGYIKQARGARDANSVERGRALVKGLRGRLDALKRDPDPRAQTRSAAWLKHFAALDESLVGLAQLKTGQGALMAQVAECETHEERGVKAAKAIKTMPQLEALETAAGPVGTATQGRLKAADQHAKRMAQAKDATGKFQFDEGQWKAVGAALRSSAQGAHGAFEKSYDALKSSCGPLVKGAKHHAVAAARTRLVKQISTAERTMKTTRKKADSTCGALKPLIAKRFKRQQALKLFVDKVNKNQDMTVKHSLIESLKKSVELGGAQIGTAGKSCAAAMRAAARADTAWEALHGR